MTRKKDRLTIDIFTQITEQLANPISCAEPGSCDIDAKFRAAVRWDIKHAKDEHGKELSNEEVAVRMNLLVHPEDKVTSDNLYSWTADSKRGLKGRNMPAVYAPALAVATNSHRAIEVLAQAARGFYMPSVEALDGEIYRDVLEEKDIRARRRQREQLREYLLKEVTK